MNKRLLSVLCAGVMVSSMAFSNELSGEGWWGSVSGKQKWVVLDVKTKVTSADTRTDDIKKRKIVSENRNQVLVISVTNISPYQQSMLIDIENGQKAVGSVDSNSTVFAFFDVTSKTVPGKVKLGYDLTISGKQLAVLSVADHRSPYKAFPNYYAFGTANWSRSLDKTTENTKSEKISMSFKGNGGFDSTGAGTHSSSSFTVRYNAKISDALNNTANSAMTHAELVAYVAKLGKISPAACSGIDLTFFQ